MPIYEYRCEPCDHSFETLIRGRGDVPHCPKCGGIDRLAKQFSVPAAPQAGGPKGSSLPICDAGSPPACGGGACRSGMCSFD
jgi:putative FmdB family regulatory protein